MTLYFMTGNKNKFKDARLMFPEIEQLAIDLPEIQSLDSKEIIEEKLREAVKNHSGEFFCEDTSLYITCLNGLPGPLIKWFLTSLGNPGISDLVSRYSDSSAVAKTIVGYYDGENMHFFEGSMKGKVVAPNGDNSFGWDVIFMPEGYDVTYAQLTREEKQVCSMRKAALLKLKEFIDSKKDK